MVGKRCVSWLWWCAFRGRGIDEAVFYEVGGVHRRDVWRLLGVGVEAVDEAVVEDEHPGGGGGALRIFIALGEIIY